MGALIFLNIAVLAFECALMYWVSAVWPQSHDDQKLMISWAFYSLSVGIASRSLNLIKDLFILNAKGDLTKIMNLCCLTSCACFLAFGVSIFQAGWSIIGILRFIKMESTNDAWFTYGIVTEVVIASILGIGVYFVILIVFFGCSLACCVGCELESLMNQLPDGLKGKFTTPGEKAEMGALIKMLMGMNGGIGAIKNEKKGTDEGVEGGKTTNVGGGNFAGNGVKTGTGAPEIVQDEEKVPLKDVEEGQAQVETNK
jgi:hypothetical protein